MFKIIGADGKEYGPVSGDQIRRWMAEGRVNTQTRVSAEASPGWKPLAEFPEFTGAASAPGTLPPPLPDAGYFHRDAAARVARGPAIALMVTSILNALMGVLVLTRLRVLEEFYATRPEFKDDPEMMRSLHLMFGAPGFASLALGIFMSVVVLIGAVRMQALKNYAFAFTACILAMIPCVTPCCLIGLPFGIWALVVLSRADVKSQFG